MKNTFYTRSGFTLIEILFVLLVIGLILSFTLPAFRKVRFDIKNLRTQTSLAKLGEARLSFQQATKGWDIAPGSHFTGADAKNWATATCNHPGLSGVPPSAVMSGNWSGGVVTPDQLFACGFLNWRDFVDSPYTFYICNARSGNQVNGCSGYGVLASAISDNASLVGADYVWSGNYETGYWMNVDLGKQIWTSKDNLENIDLVSDEDSGAL